MNEKRSTLSINEQESWENYIIDEALRSYPLQPAPPNLIPEVMRRIQKRNSAAWYNVCRGWVHAPDLLIVTALLLAWQIWSQLPLDWTARIQFRFLIWHHNLNYFLPKYGVLVGLLLMLVGLGLLAGLMVWLTRQKFISTKNIYTTLF